MNKTIFSLVLLTALLGCSKENSQTAMPAAKGIGISRQIKLILESTERFDSESVLAALAATMRAGLPLSSADAERCLKIETARPDLGPACLLAWSMGKERSAVLEDTAVHQATYNRSFAIAAIRSENALDRLNTGALKEILKLLKHDPVWLRAKAVLIWERSHPSIGLLDAEEIGQLLQGGGARSPADYRFTYLALRTMDPSAAAALLMDHCNPLVTDDLRLRCWRFLSAFADPTSGAELPAEFDPWLPSGERAWQLMRVALPARARLLTRYAN
ncbi:MAG: hypothetical protein AB7K68_16970 [Bacteriovoracia bacterium]